MAEAAKEKTRLEVLSDNLWADKSDLGRQVRARAKELFPDIVTPDEQAETAVAPLKGEVEDLKKQLTGALDRLAAREKADSDLKAENDMAVKLAEARKAFGLTDAGYEKMVKRMQETGNVTDALAAAAWVVSQMPKPEPTTTPSWMPESANLFGSQKREEQWESLHKDPRKYLDDQLREFVRDPDRYVAETFGQ
jgi:hypothetical protein